MTNDQENKTIKTKVEPQNDEPNEETYAAMEAAEKKPIYTDRLTVSLI